MAKRTIDTEFYGSVAMGNPESSFAEHTLVVSYDFSKKGVAASKVVPMIAIPKGFYITSLAVVQTKKTNADVSVTFGLASDSGKSVGEAVGLKAATLVRKASVANPQFCDEADCLCMIMPASLGEGVDEILDGSVDVCVRGFEAFCEGVAGVYEDLESPQYRKNLQTEEQADMNVSGGQFDA